MSQTKIFFEFSKYDDLIGNNPFNSYLNPTSKPIDGIDELVTQLSSILELDELEVRLYLNLLRIGPVTASVLAKEQNIDRKKSYRVIDKLLQMQMVSITFSKPRLCIANKPEDILSTLLRKKENHVNQIKKTKDELVKKINFIIPINYSNSLPFFHVIQDTPNIYSEIEKLIEQAISSIFIITTLKDLSKMYHTSIPEKIKKCEKKGIQVSLLAYLEDYSMAHFVSEFGASQTKISKRRSNGRIIVEKGNAMIMSDSVHPDGLSGVESDFAMYTNSPEMVDNIHTLCTLLWERSEYIDLPNLQTK